MPIANGTRIGPYEIAGWLGAGSMGDVYRARDSRLGRDVAIKLIPEAFAIDPSRVRRFEQEARAAGQLNHPNILVVYDVGANAGAPYIVSEMLEGQSLRRPLDAGALPPAKAADYARQIADGLGAAHDKGIVHRDVKPDNVFITNEGRVKILDFGVAKLTSPEIPGHADPAVPGETEHGTVVGTASYMSPEQARGDDVDSRSDLFSVGAILYEMITGRQAFSRATAIGTKAAILNEEPAPLPPDVAPAFERIVWRCLEKAREARFQSARDLAFALEGLTPAPAMTVAQISQRSGRRREGVAWAVAALAVAMVAIAWLPGLGRRAADPRTRVLAVPAPDGASLATEEAPAISPDGRELAFVAYDAGGKRMLYLRVLDSAAARALPNTEGASLPFWSPNSRSIGFFAQGKLKTLDVAAGRVQTLWNAGGARGGTWSPDDLIVFVPRPFEGPYVIAAAGGEARHVASDGGPGARGWFPSFLPDGRHFLIFVPAPIADESGIFIASLDSPVRTRLLTSRSNAVYVAPGFLLFWREGALVAQPFDSRTRTVGSNAVTVATAVGLNPVTNQSLFSVSNADTLVFFAGAVGQSELVWVDRSGAHIGAPGPKGAIVTVALSPDATSVVYDSADPRTASMDLWQLTFARGQPSRLTFNPGNDVFPLWSPDGARIAFMSFREKGAPQLYVLDANSAGNERLLLESNLPKVPSGWSTVGQPLFYTVIDPKSSGDVWALPPHSTEGYPVVHSTADERYGTLSPDGRWLAYVSNESGAYEVFVRAFPGPGVLRQVSNRGGFQPQWRADGRELFYLAADKTLMAIAFDGGPATFDSAPPAPLFVTRAKSLEIQPTARNYAVSADGRFLLANATEEAVLAPITVVLDWTSVLQK